MREAAGKTWGGLDGGVGCFSTTIGKFKAENGFEGGEVDVSISKVKDKDMGGLGKVQLHYNYEAGTYSNSIVRFSNEC